MDNATGPVVVLLSGGVDSTTLLHQVVKQRGASVVHALSFLYGQRHAREVEMARWQAPTKRPGVPDVAAIAGFIPGVAEALGHGLIATGNALAALRPRRLGRCSLQRVGCRMRA